MYNLDLGLAPDPKKTAKNCNYFLKNDFERYLNLAGMHRNQLSSPQLSFAPGSTNHNGVENSVVNEAYDDITKAEPARRAVSAIYRAMDNCTDLPYKPYRTILLLTYVQGLKVGEIAIRTSLAERTINKKKINALCEFAERLEYWKKVYGCTFRDLRYFEKNGRA